jgi:hypothetical protein
MIELHERVAALEGREELRDLTNAEILAHVKSIDAQLNKYKGFIGAVWFAISCVGIFFSGWKYFHKG